jgi:hypothetical protein
VGGATACLTLKLQVGSQLHHTVAATATNKMPSFGAQLLHDLQEAMADGVQSGLIIAVRTNRRAAYAASYLSQNGIPTTFITK